MIGVAVNGIQHRYADDTTVSVLIKRLQLQEKRIAIEINEQIVPRSMHATHTIQEGDRIEIVHAIGGG